MYPEVIKVTRAEEPGLKLRRAAEVILSGGVVCFPTESFYGLAVHMVNEEAVERLFEIKERQKDQPILLLTPSVFQVENYVKGISETARKLMSRFWPGGLTLLFEAKSNLSRLLTADTGKIGMRLSGHSLATKLARAVGIPITGTSANISGSPPCVTADTVAKSLGGKVDLILDGGETPGGEGSTIVDVTVSPPRVVREGMIALEQLAAFLRS
jgi:L-threonylcarbamoyladenylate synthase